MIISNFPGGLSELRSATGAVANGATKIQVGNLGFRPKVIIFRGNDFSIDRAFRVTVLAHTETVTCDIVYRDYEGVLRSEYNKNYVVITDNGFTLNPPYEYNFTSGTWTAIGV